MPHIVKLEILQVGVSAVGVSGPQPWVNNLDFEVKEKRRGNAALWG